MQIIGILGGIASGKSWVAAQLETRGAARVDADRAGHEALLLPEVCRAIRAEWGDAVFDDGGRVDRGRLAAIVFASDETGKKERRRLERIVHPHITESIQQQLVALESAGNCIAVLDAPLLLEAGWATLCHKLVWVETPREVRLERATQRGWSEHEFAAREAAQDSLDSKRRQADIIIDNSGNADHTIREIDRLWNSLTAR